jgi:FkbM family methyltransferase
MQVSRYRLKRAVLAPRTALMRFWSREANPLARAMLEAHDYRRAMIDFMAATVAKPDLLYDADIDQSSLVFDVGAYVGEWSAEIARRYDPTIYAFEPEPGAFRTLQERLHDQPRVTALEFGLGAIDGGAPLTLAGPGSAVHASDAGFGTVEVQIRDVVPVLEELGVDHIDLLKVNIEGGEYDLFDRLIETGWLARVRLVSVQFHEWYPDAYRRRRAIRRALRRHHQEVWCYRWVWEYWRRVAP